MPKQKQTTNSAKPSSYVRPLKKEMKMKMKMKMNKTNNSVSTQNPIRKEDLFVLGFMPLHYSRLPCSPYSHSTTCSFQQM